jgi:ureidoglycolate lyase
MLRAQPLTALAFKPFGAVVSAGLSAGLSANQGTAQRFDWVAPLVNGRPGARPNLAVFRAQPVALPFTVKLLERHPHSTQVFIPMVCARFLVLVAPRALDGSPQLSELTAFVCSAGQGVAYAPGVWHHPILAVDAPAEFAMLAWEDGGPQDCVEFPLAAPLEVTA